MNNFLKDNAWSLIGCILVIGACISAYIWAIKFQLFETSLGVTLIIVEVPLELIGAVIIRTLLNESRKNAEEEKKLREKDEHIKNIIRIFSKLITIQVRLTGNRLELVVMRFEKQEPWHNSISSDGLWVSISELKEIEHPYYEFAISHLQEYTALHTIFRAIEQKLGEISFQSPTHEVLETEKNELNASQEIYSFKRSLTKVAQDLNAGIPLRGTCRRGF